MMNWDTYTTLLNMEQTEGEKKKMRWYDKMSEGMRLMKEACAENENWDSCWDCPFGYICDKLFDAARAESAKGKEIALSEYIPAHWGKGEEK